jgi:hypothetical protein
MYPTGGQHHYYTITNSTQNDPYANAMIRHQQYTGRHQCKLQRNQQQKSSLELPTTAETNPNRHIPQGTDNRITNTFEAISTGTIKMIIGNTTIEWLTLYTPNSTGTIISPDRYMMDNGHIDEFLQSGQLNGHGYIRFTSKENKTIANVKMRRQKDGLWYTDSPVLLPPQCHHPSNGTTPYPDKHPHIYKANVDNNLASQKADNTNTTTPLLHTTTWVSQALQGLKHLELWHQRMGHPSPHTLQRTFNMVQGLPQLSSNYSHFHCPFCDVAKLQKSSGNKESTRDAFLPGTAFHMDLGFIWGPKTIVDNKGTTKTAKVQTAQLSHDGYSAYLIIIDAAPTRYIFCFPLKTHSPQIALIDYFLSQHGRANKACITTMPNGLLHKSNSFSDVCNKHGYAKKAHKIIDGPYKDLLNMGLECPRYYIWTDNGNELAGSSQAFRETASNQDFLVKFTAPDSSSENGLGERRHCTLKEKVQCLLYTAGLGVEFWGNALLHAVWLYNRTFHTAIDKTPFEAWTGRQPCLDQLLTFGLKITTRKAKTRTTALDPQLILWHLSWLLFHHGPYCLLGQQGTVSQNRQTSYIRQTTIWRPPQPAKPRIQASH